MCFEYSKLNVEEKAPLFATGCTSMRIETIKIHEKSTFHNKAMLWHCARNQKESVAQKALQSLNKSVYDKLVVLFRNCHAIAKMNRPLSDFKWLCQLNDAKGIQLLDSYRNRPKAVEFLNSIAAVTFDELKDKLSRCNFFCVMGDDSADSSSKEQTMWYIRTCLNGCISTDFIGTVSVQKADSESILAALKKIVAELMPTKDFFSKLVGVTTDGASVMLGCKNGVATRLKV